MSATTTMTAPKSTPADPQPRHPDLLTAFRLGPYSLANRMVMAPLTRNRAGPGGVPQALNAAYYAQRASAGLIVTEASQISPQGVGYPNTPGVHEPEQVAGWRRVTEAVQARDGRIFLQLWHVGRISHPMLQPGGSLDGALPVAPSAIRPEGQAVTHEGLRDFVTPRALVLGEIPGIIDQYRAAARNALSAGFDGVEVHAANGYLLDQFLRDGSNRRDDAYGGPIANRARLLLEVTEAVAKVWGADRVGVRISPVNSFNSMSDSDPDATFGHVARALNRFGLAYLHVVERDFSDRKPEPSYDRRRLRAAFEGPYIASGGYDRLRGDWALASGGADLIAFGKAFLANPDLPERFRRHAPLNPPDPTTFYGGGGRGYTDYPALDAAGAAA